MGSVILITLGCLVSAYNYEIFLSCWCGCFHIEMVGCSGLFLQPCLAPLVKLCSRRSGQSLVTKALLVVWSWDNILMLFSQVNLARWWFMYRLVCNAMDDSWLSVRSCVLLDNSWNTFCVLTCFGVPLTLFGSLSASRYYLLLHLLTCQYSNVSSRARRMVATFAWLT